VIRGRPALLACVVAFACRSESEPPERPPVDLSQPSARVSASAVSPSAPSASAVPSAGLAAQQFARAQIERETLALREQKISLGTPESPPRRLVLGRQFVLQLASAEARVWHTLDGKFAFRQSVTMPRAASELAQGYALVAGAEASFWFEPAVARARSLPRLHWLPGYRLVPVRESPDQVWLIAAGSLGEAVAERRLLEEEEFSPLRRQLPDYKGGPLCASSGGGFFYALEKHIVRVSGGSQPENIALPPVLENKVWRMGPARRLDQVWLATNDGDLVLLSLSEPVRELQRIHSGLVPFDFASGNEALALLGVIEQVGAPRRLELVVYAAASGKRLFDQTLEAARPTLQGDWVADFLASNQLALGEAPPRVAVGGERQFHLFDYRAQREIALQDAPSPGPARD